MNKKVKFALIVGLSIPILLLSACGEDQVNPEQENTVDKNVETVSTQVFAPHEGVNQEPIPLEVERDGTDVFVKMTS
jgi:nitrite reductase (NO-forming)